MVERTLGKGEVGSSNLLLGSIFSLACGLKRANFMLLAIKEPLD